MITAYVMKISYPTRKYPSTVHPHSPCGVPEPRVEGSIPYAPHMFLAHAQAKVIGPSSKDHRASRRAPADPRSLDFNIVQVGLALMLRTSSGTEIWHSLAASVCYTVIYSITRLGQSGWNM